MDAAQVNQKFSQLLVTNPLICGVSAMASILRMDTTDSLRLMIVALAEDNDRLAALVPNDRPYTGPA